MLNLIFGLFKVAFVAVMVLLAGAWVEWDGKTLSQHVSARVAKVIHNGGLDKVMGTLRESIPQSNAIGPATGIQLKTPKSKASKKGKGVTGEIYGSETKQLKALIEKNAAK